MGYEPDYGVFKRRWLVVVAVLCLFSFSASVAAAAETKETPALNERITALEAKVEKLEAEGEAAEGRLAVCESRLSWLGPRAMAERLAVGSLAQKMLKHEMLLGSEGRGMLVPTTPTALVGLNSTTLSGMVLAVLGIILGAAYLFWKKA